MRRQKPRPSSKRLTKRSFEREKVPTRTFQGPSDLGSVVSSIPRHGVLHRHTTPTLEAYLYPSVVPPVSSTQPFAVRVLVEDKTWRDRRQIIREPSEKAELRSNPVTVQGYTGIRLDGNLARAVMVRLLFSKFVTNH